MNGSVLLSIPVIGLLARLLTSERFLIDGNSMQPQLADCQHLLVDRMAYRRNPPNRGDLVVLRDPGQPEVYCIKRIVGLPLEHLHMNKGNVLINGVALDEPYAGGQALSSAPFPGQWLLDADEYFVLGDRRENSRDSRSFGPIPRHQIIGKAWIRFWPPRAWKRL